MNLRKKLTLLLISTSAIPLIVFTIINFYFSQSTATQAAMSENFKKASEVQIKIGNLVDKNLSGIKIIARNPAIRSYNVKEMKPVLQEAVKVYHDLSYITVANHTGQIVVKSDDSPLANISDRSFFQAAVKGQEEFVSEVLESKSTGKLIIVLSTPVRDNAEGKIIGTMQGVVELSYLNTLVKQLSANNVTVYILDRDGKVLANPSKTYTKLADLPDFKKYDFVKNALAGKNSSIESKKDGKTMLISYVKDPKTGWLICAEIPKNIAIAKSVHASIFTILIGFVLLAIVALIVSVLTSYSIKPIELLSSAANSVSSGDLSIKNIDINSKDEIGNLSRAFEKMVANLQEIVISIKDYSSKVSSASKEMIAVTEQQAVASTTTAENANQISQGTESVNSSIEKIGSNVKNLDKSMEEISKKSNIVFSVVENASNYSEMGSKALSKVNSSMSNIQKSVNDTAEVINKLDEHSKAIGKITEVIMGISEQTNLLALNAAIEAARAGEQGKGFAVVADEVRKLAEQSGEAAGQVSKLIEGIQKETENVVSVMNKGINEVDDGSVVIKDTNKYFEQIFKAIQEISMNMKEVTVSIDYMSQQEKDISTNLDAMVNLSSKVSGEVQNISASTEEQVASIEELTASAQELGSMALNLNELTNKFITK